MKDYTEKRGLMRILLTLLLPIVCSLPAAAEKVTLTVLATTDLHGNIYPVDYYLNRGAARGLAKIAILIREARTENPNNLLLDCGDTMQGTPLEYVYQTYVRTGRLPLKMTFEGPPLLQDPMMLAMNHIGYDAMVVGNHEFNFGLKNLQKARDDARFPWISANIQVAPQGKEKPFAPYFLKTIAGVKIAVIGITTPAVPSWEKLENLGAYQFIAGKEAVETALAELRRKEKPDLVLVAAHAGLGSGADARENMVYDIASGVEGIDAIVFGHTHQELTQQLIGRVLLVQPKNWGISLARMDFILERTEGKSWTVTGKSSRLIPVRESTVADPGILDLAKPYELLTERYLNTPVTESPRDLDTRLGRVEDTALADAVQIAQLYYAKADVSFTAMFNSRVTVPKGPVTVRQIASLYLYDNELYAIDGTGKMVKDALENAARYFLSCGDPSCSSGPLVNPRVVPFNYDMAEGVEYEIDLRRPEGDRIRNLRYKGRPLMPDQKLRIAMNNYRAAGSAGYTMFAGAKVLWRSFDDIRDLMIRYYSERGKLPVEPSGNWRVIPPEALRVLEKQALAEAGRANMF